jgi:hypothetical protein
MRRLGEFRPRLRFAYDRSWAVMSIWTGPMIEGEMMKGILRAVLLAVAMTALAGCATSIKQAADADKRAAYFAGGGKLAQDVTISLSKEAQAKLTDNLKFDQQRLLSTVRRALEAKGLLASAPDPSLPTIQIVVTDIRVRSSFTAVMFGFMAGSDLIDGDVIARDASGKELQRFSVSASYALGGLAGGQDESRMGWLYEAFAQQTVDELTGTAQKK